MPAERGEEAGVVVMFEGVDFGGDVGWSVGGGEGYAGLKENGTFVVALADEMYGNAGFGFAGGYHGLMNVASIHTFAPVFRQ